ncbi:MAG: tetratricopeptide repeat protein, partial [Anaerolineae bacterium]
LQKAIECYQEALRVYTPEAAPLGYAMTQNNLGTAYADLPTGDRAANLEQAIACYQEALRFWTPEAAPLYYAGTQNNLGTAYQSLPTGDRAANLEKAIQCYQEALRFYTPEAVPLDYAMTQNNLGLAYLHLPTGDRATNLKQSLHCVETALQIKGLSPWEQAEYLFTRGLAHLALGQQDQALADYQAAMPLADSITLAEALKELNEFVAAHPDTPGLDALRTLFPSPS